MSYAVFFDVETGGLKLGTLCAYFGHPPNEDAHTALYDVRLSVILARAIKEKEAE